MWPSPCRRRGPAHGSRRPGQAACPAGSRRWEKPALRLGTQASQLPGLAARGHWAAGAGGGGGGPHPSLPASPAGPAKSRWNWAQVPMCLVTGLLFEKLKRCPENPTFAFVPGAWSWSGGGPHRAVCAGWPVGGCPGTEQMTAENIIRPGSGGGRGGRRARAGPDPAPAAGPTRPRADG